MADKIVLHSYFRSSCSYRVRIALLWKGLAFETKAVNLLKGEQLDEAYRATNPMAEVPTLEIDGITLTQSVAILEYLEETRTNNPLLPSTPALRAKVRQLCEIITSGTQPVQNLRVLKKHGMEHKLEWGKWAINHGFNAFERFVSQTAGKYCVGDEVTLADVVLVPQVYNANRFDVDMSQYPTISRIHAALSDLEAFQKAAPEVQPDCPDDLRKKD